MDRLAVYISKYTSSPYDTTAWLKFDQIVILHECRHQQAEVYHCEDKGHKACVINGDRPKCSKKKMETDRKCASLLH